MPMLEHDRDIAVLSRSLTNHTPSEEGLALIAALRENARLLGETIILTSAPSRERSLAITHLEETVMWAVKAIALQTGVPVD